MIVLSSQSGPLGTNLIGWLSDEEAVKPFQKGPPAETPKVDKLWTYLSQYTLTVHHMQGMKNELAICVSRNNS